MAQIVFSKTTVSVVAQSGQHRWGALREGLSLKPVQNVSKTRMIEAFKMVGVSTSDTILRHGDVVSLWAASEGGQCLALIPPRRTMEFGQLMQSLQTTTPDDVWRPALRFQDNDTGPRCWFRVLLRDEAVTTHNFQPWFCDKCNCENSDHYRTCRTCHESRREVRTASPIQLDDTVIILPVAVEDTHALASVWQREVRCEPKQQVASEQHWNFRTIAEVDPNEDNDEASSRLTGPSVRSALINSVASVLTTAVEANNDGILASLMSRAIPVIAGAAETRYAENPTNIVSDIVHGAAVLNNTADIVGSTAALAAATVVNTAMNSGQTQSLGDDLDTGQARGNLSAPTELDLD